MALKEIQHQAPNRVREQEDDTNSVWHAMTLCECISEAARGPDVLLKEVAADEQAYENADQVVANSVGKEVGGDHKKKDQCTGHLQPIYSTT